MCLLDCAFYLLKTPVRVRLPQDAVFPEHLKYFMPIRYMAWSGKLGGGRPQ